jgi:DNA-binding response OmpR family regulator
MTANAILAVDDEPKILEAVSALFQSKGFIVYTAENGAEALEISARENLSLVVLDLMLPDISGEEVCARIRQKSRAPIIMLTAKAEEDDLLNALSLGADDYMTKPFSLRELYARAEAAMRRYELPPGFSVAANVVKKGGREIPLTANELKILTALMNRPGKIFSRAELIDAALGHDFDGYDRAIDSHIKNLRQKIEDDPKNPSYIQTVHRLGYKFAERL